jgi:PIN domain nuclease of toxin-antitoxin system
MEKIRMKSRKVLLDTHALIWWAANDKKLSLTVRRLIQSEDTAIFVSAATAWEIATKVRLGKLSWSSPESVESYCAGQSFELLPIDFAHASRAGAWTYEHGDPFDRMLAAQSEIEGMPLATNDPKIQSFGVEAIW